MRAIAKRIRFSQDTERRQATVSARRTDRIGAPAIRLGGAVLLAMLLLALFASSALAGQVTTEPATGVTGTEATLHGTVSPENETVEECFFELIEEGKAGPPPRIACPQAIPKDNAAHPVSLTVTSLTPGTFYYARLRVKQAGVESEGEYKFFTTKGARIEYERAGDVLSESATLNTQVATHEVATTYHFEYGPTTTYGTNTQEFNVAGAEKPIVVAEAISGLSPNTTYHWRTIVVNGGVTVTGPDRVFTTRPPTAPLRTNCPNQNLRTGFSALLPDCRAYELVSPAKKAGNVFVPEGLHGTCNLCLPGEFHNASPMKSSPTGEAVTYVGDPFTAGLSSAPNQYLARRGISGWITESLSPPTFNGNEGGAYEGMSEDLSRGVVYQSARNQISPAAPPGYKNLYYREGNGTPEPLVATAPPSYGSYPPHEEFRVGYEGANIGTSTVPGFKDIFFTANDHLTSAVPTAPAAPVVAENETNLYQWQGGQLSLVNVLPGNAQAAVSAKLAALPGDHSISNDGSHVFWTAGGELFVRLNGTQTKKINDAGEFVTASTDGSEVLLNDGCLYSVANESCVQNLTGGKGGFVGLLGAAENLSHIYFVDNEVLTSTSIEGGSPVAGQVNLYAWESGSLSYIRTYENEGPGSAETEASWTRDASQRFAQVTGDGSYLAFGWSTKLNNYDNLGPCVGNFGNHEETEDGLCREVYVYSAAKHRLSCASCNFTGQTPIGFSNLSRQKEYLGNPTLPLPGNLPTDGGGRLFFESQDILLPQDQNGHIADIYEWVPEGIEGCTESRGCQSMISSGTSPTDSAFVDSSPDGKNVFFVTRQQLLPQDKDELLDLYDARVDGGFGETKAQPCESEEACRTASLSPPAAQTPGTSTLVSPGNEKPKQEKKHHKKPKKHKKKHHKKGKKHSSKKHGHGKKKSKRSTKNNGGGSK